MSYRSKISDKYNFGQMKNESDGKIRKFNPLDGKSIEEVEFKGGATSNPAIANSSLYLLTDIGNLIAFK